MSLRGAFARVQQAGAQFYLKLAQFFVENPLIRETWVAMAHDMEQQAASLNGLPARFWKMHKSNEEALLSAIRQSSSMQTIVKPEDKSLHNCYVRSLDIEEPLILLAYVPLIRLLRTEWSDHALDFYIIVKSHVARISRIIQPFSVDPVLLQRVQNLQQWFEFEVQSPAIAEIPSRKKEAQKKKGRSQRTVAAKRFRKARVVSRSAKRTLPSLRKRVQRIAKRAKPIVRKLEIARRRARR